MLVKALTVKNSNGDPLTFGRHFQLLHGLDLSGLLANLNYAQSTQDGANYQRTLLDVREFDLSIKLPKRGRDSLWIEERRLELFKVFNPKHNPIRLDITTQADKQYYLMANLVSAPVLPTDFNNDNRAWNRVLLQFSCDDPYIYDTNSTVVELATWIGAFEFPLEIPDGEGIEMGYRSPSLIANVFNSGDSDTGMIIRFRAIASISNPSLINVNTYEVFKLKTEMQGGDVIEVSTYTKKKTVTLIRNNVRTNIFNTVTLESIFLQLSPGDNLFRYDADTGLDNLEVSMHFTAKRVGI